jgi:hypothetical protein
MQMVDVLARAYAIVDEVRARRTSVTAASTAALALLREACADPRAAQHALLRTLLREASACEFGRAHGFDEITSVEEFRARVPVRTYDELKPYIDRAVAGETDVLRPGQPGFLAQTSGTTGVPKFVPWPADMTAEFVPFLLPAFGSIEEQHPGAIAGRQMILGRFIEGESAGKIPVGAASGFVRHLLDSIGAGRVPGAVFDEPRLEVRYYAMLRYMLAQPLVWLAALNPSTLLTFLDQLDAFGARLAEDLEHGEFRRGPDGVEALLRELPAPPASPERAALLAASIARHGKVALEEVCPELRVVSTWKGGNAKHYLPQVRARIPTCTIRSEVSGSSEAALLIPLDPETEGGVPPLLSTFVEMLPIEAAPNDGIIHELDELRPNQGYRFIITNRRSMYRFVMEDVFYLERFEGRTPVLRFSHRHGLQSSITGEKLTEIQIVEAFEHARAVSGLVIDDYQARPEWGEPPAYALLVEVADAPRAQCERFIAAFEARLHELNVEYAAKRTSRRLGASTLVLLPPGELRRWQKADLAATGRSDAQAKIARLRRDLLELKADYPRVRV